MWKRGKGVVAHILTTGLLGVADKLALLVVVDGLAAERREHNAEDDEHRQPDLPHKGGVVGDLVQQTRQETPAHDEGGTHAVWSALGEGNKERDTERKREMGKKELKADKNWQKHNPVS